MPKFKLISIVALVAQTVLVTLYLNDVASGDRVLHSAVFATLNAFFAGANAVNIFLSTMIQSALRR